MSEDKPTIPTPEALIIREQVIAIIREKGLEDSESIRTYLAWCDIEEKKVTDDRSQYEVELRKAELLLEAGVEDYVYTEILDPMRAHGAEFFDAHPDLKAKIDSFYE